MTTVTLTSTDSRHVKALAILAQRGQWLTLRLRDGQTAVGIPSQTKKGLVHLVSTDGQHCDCYDFRHKGRGNCKHSLAVKLSCFGTQPQPASDTVDGLAQMLEQRLADEKPVLEMVREEDGDISWRRPAERRELDRILGKTPPVYETDQRRLSDKYADVFERFNDDGPHSVQKESYL